MTYGILFRFSCPWCEHLTTDDGTYLQDCEKCGSNLFPLRRADEAEETLRFLPGITVEAVAS